MNAANALTRAETEIDTAWRGRLVENAAGAHLLNHLHGPEWTLAYWRDGDDEVDYVVRRGRRVWALEIKSGRGAKLSGLDAFRQKHPGARALVTGSGGIALEEFFARNPREFFV